jgi:hypothetical protein
LPFLLLLLLAVGSAISGADSDAAGRRTDGSWLDGTLEKAYAALRTQQSADDVAFRAIPLRWAQQKGLFQSDIHLNFVGGWGSDFLRRDFAIPDTNGFVSMFVVTMLLECEALGAVALDEASVAAALDAIASYHDRNAPPGAAVMSFWPQALVGSRWSAHPPNLYGPLQDFDSLAEFLLYVLEELGLKQYAGEVTAGIDNLQTMLDAFHVPADTDDSGCNLAMGGWLAARADRYPALYARWKAANPDAHVLFDSALRFAYRPLGGGGGANMTANLDPRSYYFMHAFLNGAVPPLNERSSFVATWLMGLQADRRDFAQIAMPFNVNNVDLAVSSNFLYGLTNAVVRDLFDGAASKRFASDADLRTLYESTAQLLAWGVTSGAVFRRPDIGMLYYPSRFDFMWMLARNLRLLRNVSSSDPVIVRTAELFEEVLSGDGTAQLLSVQQNSGAESFWDDFLGDYGSQKLGDDRLFTTSLVVNTLMDVWTVPTAAATNGQTCLRWRPSASAGVRAAVLGGVTFLNNNLFSGRFSLMNAFFSGSMKANSTNFFAYPGTYAQFLNGTALDPHGDLPSGDQAVELVYAMDGISDNGTYNTMLGEKWWTFDVPPPDQVDFNVPGEAWPFWSSDAMTYSTSMLALSNFRALCPDS